MRVNDFKKFNLLVKAALDSIQSEMHCYPCLGLVSDVNSGSHHDMDIHTFEKSYEIFPLYLNAIYHQNTAIKTFDDLRKIGFEYEQLMFQKTNGINTHKGLIFALGIFFYCLLNNNDKVKLQTEITQFVQSLDRDFYNKNYQSTGINLFNNENIKGARHTALTGYQIVFDAYHFFLNIIAPQNLSEYENNFALLLYIMLNMQDTTLINKIGSKKWVDISQRFKKLLSLISIDYHKNIDFINEMNQYAIENNISPGGAADILVLVNILIRINF